MTYEKTRGSSIYTVRTRVVYSGSARPIRKRGGHFNYGMGSVFCADAHEVQRPQIDAKSSLPGLKNVQEVSKSFCHLMGRRYFSHRNFLTIKELGRAEFEPAKA